MAAGGNIICGNQNLGDLLGNEKLPCSSEFLDSFWLPKSLPSIQGPKTMGDIENVGGGTTSAAPFQSLGEEENGFEDFDGCFNSHGGKKRRLTASQVQFLEKNFELENKLEPDRKIHLAKQLGLQPRQVAIWFQNRRARSKNQRLEKDFDSLKAVYDKLKDDYQSLLKENQVLQNEVMLLKDKLLVKGKENLETFDDDAIKLLEAEPEKAITNTTEACKQEEAIFDYDSPHYTEGNHSSLTDPADSSSQDDDDNLSKGLLPPPPPPCFLKLEDCCYDDDPPTNSCNFGFSMEDHPFWSWPY